MQKKEAPEWFYISSIFAAFLFTIFLSVYATIHFGSIEYMNLMFVFMIITLTSFFLINFVYFLSEKMGWHSYVPLLFFIGVISIVIYAFKAVDATDMVRYSIIYTIVVSALSVYVLVIKKKLKPAIEEEKIKNNKKLRLIIK